MIAKQAPVLLAAAFVGIAWNPAATGSIWVTDGATSPALRVDSRGYAEVSWTAGGTRKTQLVPPVGRVLPGGSLSGPDTSTPTRVVGLPFARVVRRTPDGTLWALQTWQAKPGEAPSLRLARWKGSPTQLVLALTGDRLEGRVTFQGRPVAGFTTTPEGRRARVYVYLDCFGCPGSRSGWTRLLGVAPKADGSFAVRLAPQWDGRRYRATVAGPNLGSTFAPDAQAVVSGS
jgi:hypothetical protein